MGYIPSVVAQEKKGHTGLVFSEEETVRGDDIYYDIMVKEVLPNSPASKEGLMRNDKLVSINGIATGHGKNTYKEVNTLMEGNQNSFVTINIERKTGTKNIRLITYTLERVTMHQEPSPKVFGIGVTLVTDSVVLNEKRIYVVRVNTIIPGYPAEVAGMKTGDIITEINHRKITAEATQLMNAVIKVLLIDQPEKVHISVARFSLTDVQVLNFDMIRQNISPFIKNEIVNKGMTPEFNPTIQPIQKTATNDTDGDGIEDRLDQCPDEAGTKSINPFLNGCPESK